jgi:hypothetical protein
MERASVETVADQQVLYLTTIGRGLPPLKFQRLCGHRPFDCVIDPTVSDENLDPNIRIGCLERVYQGYQ